jgi:hypothetical protein
VLTVAVTDLDRAIARAEGAQRELDKYMLKHRDELDRLPRVEAAFDTRLAQLVDADVAEPPSYLRALGAPPKDLERLARWREAAGFVEQYRVENGITAKHQPLGREPEGSSGVLWREETRHMQTLAGRVHSRTSDVSLGAELP